MSGVRHVIKLSAGEQRKSPIIIEMDGEETTFVLEAGDRSKAVILDQSSSKHHTIELRLGAETSVHFISISTGSVRNFQSVLSPGARVHWHCVTLGSSPGEHTLESRLVGRQARSDIDWVFLVQDSERQEVSVRNIFAAESGGGEIILKGVAEGKAHAGCRGMIEITEQGGGTDTYLTEDVLMLDPTAKIDAVPALEIRTNDVKASHSATVSRVTPEDLFYFRSRGIDPLVARRMYVEGFLTDLLDRIPDPNIRTTIHAAVTESSLLSAAESPDR